MCISNTNIPVKVYPLPSRGTRTTIYVVVMHHNVNIALSRMRKALEKGWLIEHEPGKKKVIFISHTWHNGLEKPAHWTSRDVPC